MKPQVNADLLEALADDFERSAACYDYYTPDRIRSNVNAAIIQTYKACAQKVRVCSESASTDQISDAPH